MSGVLASCDCVLGLIVSFNRPLDSARHHKTTADIQH